MRNRIRQFKDHGVSLACAKLVLLVLMGQAYSQTAAPPVAQPPAAQLAPSDTPAQVAPPVSGPEQQPPPPPPAPPGNPGLVEEFGKFLKKSADGLSSTFKGSQQTLEDWQSRTKGATENLTRVQSVVTGRSMCPMAANGAPDCEAASLQLCKGKGYKEGKSLDIETSEKCSAKVYISGRTGAPGECRTENYVTRAVCQ
jgi:hypothetical protein